MEMNNFDDSLLYAAYEEQKYDNVLAKRNYVPQTTFYSDLSIAEFYGEESIRETYENVRRSWLDSYKMFTEFVMCLKDKAREWTVNVENSNKLSDVYNELFYKGQETFFRRYEGDTEKINYYYNTLNYDETK